MDNTYTQNVPSVGLGTYNMTSEEAELLTYESLKHGYRHIDTAAVYKNENGVAKGLEKFPQTAILSDEVYDRLIFDNNEIPTFLKSRTGHWSVRDFIRFPFFADAAMQPRRIFEESSESVQWVRHEKGRKTEATH